MSRSHHPSRRAPLALLSTLALTAGLTAQTSPAYAADTRHEGDLRIAMGEWCDLGYEAATVGSVAGLIYDDAAPPRAGDVLYAYVEVAAVAEPCIEQQMIPDIVLPDGMRLAVSAAHPIRCVRWDYSSGRGVESPETQLCPSAPSPGVTGGAYSFPTAQGDLWRLPYQTGYEIQVPVMAQDAGETRVRFNSQVIDGVTNPVLMTTSPAVTVRQGEEAAPHVEASVNAKVRLGRTDGRVPVSHVARPAGAEVRMVVSVRRDGRWLKVGSAAVQAAGEKRTTRVPVSRTWRQRLKGRTLDARVVTSVRTASGERDADRDSFRLRG